MFNYGDHHRQLDRFRKCQMQGRFDDASQLLSKQQAVHYALPKDVRVLRCAPNEHGEWVPVEDDYVDNINS